jgi:hypothetical protein
MTRAIPLTPRLACRTLPILAILLLAGCAQAVHPTAFAAPGALPAHTRSGIPGIPNNGVSVSPSLPGLEGAPNSRGQAAGRRGRVPERAARRLGPVLGRALGGVIGRTLGRALGGHHYSP